ncbi:MAG: hypothetical protein CVU56_24020 [Deltaproteobacteria bacterium HGW-Deltaproteobacteria-14]|jgi:hypothetical protein|nr:MAG: hypothetical protein CVU56_24020 [Deltaproteobacteria bacterium HGW-Deltaproteobacteria-14]
MKKLFIFTHLFSGAILIRFALSKLFAWPISVEAFVEMAQPLGIDPTFFRVFTGVVIATVVVGYFSSLYLVLRDKHLEGGGALTFVKLSNLLGVGVMSGALLSEFFLRTAPKVPLVLIASAIVVFSAFNLFKLNEVRGLRQ